MHIGAFNLTQLRLIEALARESSLTKAAAEIGLTQGAASHALVRLRRELHDPIFIRTSDGMRPTPFGARIADAVRIAISTLHGALEGEKEFKPRTSKRALNIFMSDTGQLLYLPRLIERLSSEAPGVTVRVRPLPPKAPHLMLEAGEVDLAIGTFTTLISGCRQRRLFRERYVCVVRKDHPAFARGMTIDAFKEVPHVLAETSGYVHELLDRWLAKQKLRRVVKLHVPHFLILPLLIAQSDLLAITASRIAKLFAQIVPLQIMNPPTKLPSYDIKLFWHERFDRDPANRWFRSVFVDLFGE